MHQNVIEMKDADGRRILDAVGGIMLESLQMFIEVSAVKYLCKNMQAHEVVKFFVHIAMVTWAMSSVEKVSVSPLMNVTV